jgi:hypothetical protein
MSVVPIIDSKAIKINEGMGRSLKGESRDGFGGDSRPEFGRQEGGIRIQACVGILTGAPNSKLRR